jgi:hypothetical protein
MLGRISLGARNDSQESHVFSDVGLECETRVGSDMAPMDCNYPTAIDHRPSRLWQSVAPSRRAPLDLQNNSQPVSRAVIIVADCVARLSGDLPTFQRRLIKQWARIVGAHMDPRFIFSALAGVVFLVIIFATVTTVRYISNRSDSGISRPNGGLGIPSIWRQISTG